MENEIKIWSRKDNIEFIISVVIEKVHRYKYDKIYPTIPKKLTIKEKLIDWLYSIIVYRFFPNWRTKLHQGYERLNVVRYSRLDDFYQNLKRI